MEEFDATACAAQTKVYMKAQADAGEGSEASKAIQKERDEAQAEVEWLRKQLALFEGESRQDIIATIKRKLEPLSSPQLRANCCVKTRTKSTASDGKIQTRKQKRKTRSKVARAE